MTNVTYIFSQGRKKTLQNDQIQAREFFYGVDYVKKSGYNTNIIEFNEVNSFTFKFFNLFDKFMNKVLSLPFYTASITSYKNLKLIFNSEKLFLVNESTGCSSIFIIFIVKNILRKNIEITLFVMGLYSKKLKYVKLKFLHNFVIKLLTFNIDNILFLGKAEYEKAKSLHKKYDNRLKFLPFCVDTDFWTTENNNISEQNNNIIFVGNDGNRDYKLVLDLAEHFKNLKFTIVSSNQIFNDITLPNVDYYKGFWGKSNISDLDLKELYSSAKVSIIPLIETSQPSGQSVALQSMSLGVPVVISKTSGFWDYEHFVDERNILFVNNHSKEYWIKRINEIFLDTELLKNISINAKNTIKEFYNLNVLYSEIRKILNNT